jgi:peptidyl-prolyl cis-trans isomerase A (cyclophilin A)
VANALLNLKMKSLFASLFSIAIYLIPFQSHSQNYYEAFLNPGHEIWNSEPPRVFKIKITTSKGFFVLEIHRDWAPIGAMRFYNLARTGFLDDSRFYRVRAGTFVQFGIPGNPTLAKVWEHESMKDDPPNQSNRKGYISYAMTGPDTRTTQLFINLKDNLEFDIQGFVSIGKVVDGMDVVASLYSDYAEKAGGGMRGGKQARLFADGNAHLDKDFPKLDKLIKAELIQ